MKKIVSLLFLLMFGICAHGANPVIEMNTSMGAIVLELYPDKAPKTVENFLRYVKDGHYNGTIFHRVIDGFMIQGGGFSATTRADGSTEQLTEKSTRSPIPNEAKNGLRNEPGTIAMARTSDPQSATAQFFINLVDNMPLNPDFPRGDGWGYAVFGKVTQGFEVVQAIAKVQRTRVGYYSDVPVKPIVIESVRLAGDQKPAKAK